MIKASNQSDKCLTGILYSGGPLYVNINHYGRLNRVKLGDRLKYFWYKNVRMNPLKAVLTLVYSFLCCSIPFIFHHPFLSISDLVVVAGCLTLNLTVRCKRLNDYLVLVRYPFSPYFYLYQSVRKSCALPSDDCKAKAVYLAQMRKVLEQLPPGRYRTVTQPMFTRAILRSHRVMVIRCEKAYHKKTQQLVQEVYSTHTCKDSKTYKQFYFVEFISVNTAIISRNG